MGVDKRVFQKLALSENFSIYYIDWIQPLANESIRSYAKRLSAVIDQTEPFALIGLSFGGIMAVEINKFMQAAKVIIISSAANESELPWFVKAIRFIPLYKIVPPYLLKKPGWLFYYLFNIQTQEERNLINELLRSADPVILKWSIDAVAHWNNKTIPSNLIHVHGNADRLLPIKHTTSDIVVEGGGHFMVYSKADEVSTILNNLLA